MGSQFCYIDGIPKVYSVRTWFQRSDIFNKISFLFYIGSDTSIIFYTNCASHQCNLLVDCIPAVYLSSTHLDFSSRAEFFGMQFITHRAVWRIDRSRLVQGWWINCQYQHPGKLWQYTRLLRHDGVCGTPYLVRSTPPITRSNDVKSLSASSWAEATTNTTNTNRSALSLSLSLSLSSS